MTSKKASVALAGVINDMRREEAEQVPEALAMISEPA